MLGAVVALRRGEHMRMTALVNNVSPARRAQLETVALAASLAFLILILALPSSTPTKNTSSSPRRWNSAMHGARQPFRWAWA